MLTESKLLVDQILAELAPMVLRAVEAARRDAYERGLKDATARILSAAQGRSSIGIPDAEAASPSSTISASMVGEFDVALQFEGASISQRKRAPKGLPQELVARVILESNGGGVTIDDILHQRHDDFEKVIAASTIRGVLRKYRDKGVFAERNGRWYLANSRADNSVSLQVQRDEN